MRHYRSSVESIDEKLGSLIYFSPSSSRKGSFENVEKNKITGIRRWVIEKGDLQRTHNLPKNPVSRVVVANSIIKEKREKQQKKNMRVWWSHREERTSLWSGSISVTPLLKNSMNDLMRVEGNSIRCLLQSTAQVINIVKTLLKSWNKRRQRKLCWYPN